MYVYVPGDKEVSVYVVWSVEPIDEPFLYILYATSPLLSVEALQVSVTALSPLKVARMGVVGGVVSRLKVTVIAVFVVIVRVQEVDVFPSRQEEPLQEEKVEGEVGVARRVIVVPLVIWLWEQVEPQFIEPPVMVPVPVPPLVTERVYVEETEGVYRKTTFVTVEAETEIGTEHIPPLQERLAEPYDEGVVRVHSVPPSGYVQVA